MEKETCHILLMAVCDLWPVAKVEGWKVRPKIGKKERNQCKKISLTRRGRELKVWQQLRPLKVFLINIFR